MCGGDTGSRPTITRVYNRRSKKAYLVSLWLDSGLPIGLILFISTLVGFILFVLDLCYLGLGLFVLDLCYLGLGLFVLGILYLGPFVLFTCF